MSALAMSLFDRLVDYERRSVAHDVAGASQRDDDATWNGLVFRLGQARLTLGVSELEEILPLPTISPVPGAVDWLLGMANVRGNLVTIVDLGWYLFGVRTPHAARTRLILTRLQGKFTGLVVDEVYGQRHFNLADAREISAEDALGGLVERAMVQGSEHWGRFRFDRLARDPGFLDGAARRPTAATADTAVSAY
ncbi:MAG: chemotaxis protein CheW [Wenzhouxiangellaceae bacterium]|nr:chemotaxis protein CheW [Wenzhouxiangellaceae bacterium]